VSYVITRTLVSSRHVAANCGLLRGVSDNLGDSDRASAVAWQEDDPSPIMHALARWQRELAPISASVPGFAVGGRDAAS
jgi:hypothetical protein